MKCALLHALANRVGFMDTAARASNHLIGEIFMGLDATLSVNGRTYCFPTGPVVVVCIDGCAPRYLETAQAAGVMPALDRIQKQGCYRLARSAMPSFTNPNNLSIVTGVPPS